MNKLERSYADRLERMKQMDEILFWSFEQVKLRLADKTFYNPDFFVVTASKQVEFHECKGFMHDVANVKIKVAASLHPFVFKVCRWKNKQWEVVEV